MHKEDISKETVKETKKLLGLMKEKKKTFVYPHDALISAAWFEVYRSSSTG